MIKAIFLDRDGVINKDRSEYTWRIEDFEFLPGVFEGLKALTQKGYKLIVITNQGGVAKGKYGHTEVQKLHEYMISTLNQNGVEILEIYYCPHHPDHSICLCRKPGSLLIEKSVARFNVDVTASFMIGDMERDILAAQSIDITGIKVDSNSNFLESIKAIP
ncbi:MAG: D-glycero-alpha-D-manno-heptose-1,7-bisphosphate 7-phosphatase [Bacteroidota bacterium]|jgi:D-glycero-D-manno-heptose 1,7-bisphosphate phosphatase